MQTLRKVGAVAVLAAVVVAIGSPADAGWREGTILERSVTVRSPIDLDIVSVEGSTRAEDRRFYDINIRIGSRRLPTVTLYSTSAKPLPPVDTVLVTSSSKLMAVDLTVAYRYDEDARVCPVAADGMCPAYLPVNPDSGAQQASPGAGSYLSIRAAAGAVGHSVEVAQLRIPFAGQVMATVG